MKRFICLLFVAAMFSLAACDTDSRGGEDIPQANAFSLGGDISSIIEAEENGCVFSNQNGEKADMFEILADSGMNSVRVRLWNDPVDECGIAYNNGHNDLETAIAIGKRATEAGFSVCIDFHYSDYWADPVNQIVPKAWAGMSLDEKKEALFDYTFESLCALLDAGVNVHMVQIGNETTSGLAGENGWDAMTALMSSGSHAVREVAGKYGIDIAVAMHFTGQEHYAYFAKTLSEHNVDYDIFAVSYYPYWHGGISEHVAILDRIISEYGKKILIAEFSYPYTYENFDRHGNSIGVDSNLEFSYEISRDGQKEALENAISFAEAFGESCVGFYYWEPAWIGYQGTNGAGSPWDNQALFDKNGDPLPALEAFNRENK